MDAIIGKKLIQAEAFLTNGERIPVTKIDVSDNTVLEIKDVEKHGYASVRVGFGIRKNAKKPVIGLVKKVNLQNAPFLISEIGYSSSDVALTIGKSVKVEEILKPGDIVKVTGISKGKGFAGVVKRHNFRGGPRTHGQSDRERAPGSIGQTTTPGRVYKGKRMAGRMGNVKSSVLNLQIIKIEVQGDRTIVLVKGLVPGSVNSLVKIKKTGELSAKKFVPLLQNEAENDDEKNVEIKVSEVKNQQNVENADTETITETDINDTESKVAVNELVEDEAEKASEVATEDK